MDYGLRSAVSTLTIMIIGLMTSYVINHLHSGCVTLELSHYSDNVTMGDCRGWGGGARIGVP